MPSTIIPTDAQLNDSRARLHLIATSEAEESDANIAAVAREFVRVADLHRQGSHKAKFVRDRPNNAGSYAARYSDWYVLDQAGRYLGAVTNFNGSWEIILPGHTYVTHETDTRSDAGKVLAHLRNKRLVEA